LVFGRIPYCVSVLVLLQVKERRTNLPLVQQKRHDLYELVDRSSAAS
jgi:hypothetical protein